MLFRFSLYGFLKNQRYYEPFFLLYVLSFLQRAENPFLLVGLLIAFREVAVNLLEIPSGAIADGFGRRRAMIFSLTAYCLSFLLFGLARHYVHLYLPVLFFAVGEAFRTGTHKAIIFDWLERHDRLEERTAFYGYTRSWAKIGAAVSVIPAALLVFFTENYRWIFWLCIPVYVVNLANLYSYPRELDAVADDKASVRHTWEILKGAFRQITKNVKLRGLTFESMLQEGIFKSLKDYVQPLVKTAALGMPIMLMLAERQRTALLMAPVFILLYLSESLASRKAHLLTALKGDEEGATSYLWKGIMIIYLILAVSLGLLAFAGMEAIPGLQSVGFTVALLSYIALYAAQSLWQPNQISRFARESESTSFATVLSMESQARTIAAMLAAPLIGWFIDLAGGHLWPLAIVGAAAAVAGLAQHHRTT